MEEMKKENSIPRTQPAVRKQTIFDLTPAEEEMKRKVLEQEKKGELVLAMKDRPLVAPKATDAIRNLPTDTQSKDYAKDYALTLFKDPKAFDNPFNVLREVMVGYKGCKPADRSMAAKTFLEYAFGKVKDHIEIENINPLTDKSDKEMFKLFINAIGIDVAECLLKEMRGEVIETSGQINPVTGDAT